MSAVSSLSHSASPGVLLAAARHSPFVGNAITVQAPEGSAISTFVETAFPEKAHHEHVVVEIDGVVILPFAWQTTKPAAGQVITIVFRPGKDIVRTILQIAVIAVASFVGGIIGGPWGAIAAAGITMLGNYAVNMLIPIEQPKGGAEQPQPFYSITGARNSAQPWGTAPMLLGRHRIVPDLAGQPVQETRGGKTFIRIPLLLGVCPMAVSDWKIGETPLSSYTGWELETRLTEDAPAHTLYVGDPTPAVVNVQLGTGFTSRTTATDIDEIVIAVGFRGGLGGYDSKQRKVSKTVSLNVEYRKVGDAGAWATRRADTMQANEAAADLGEPYRPELYLSGVTFAAYVAALGSVSTPPPSGTYSITRADPGKGFQEEIRIAVPRGQYDVRVSRTAAESTDPNTVDAVHWEFLTSIKSEVDPFPIRKLATAVLRIESGPQTNGVIEQINCIAESIVPTFSSGALADPDDADAAEHVDEETSRSPAELGLWVLRGPQNAIPATDAEIDWPSWADFASKCITAGYTFDEYIRQRIGKWELLRRILRAAHARPVTLKGRVGVVMDRARTGEVPSAHFAARNVNNFRWRRTFNKPVHGVRVGFANEDNGWESDEVIVYMPGYNAGNASIHETFPFPGLTNADRIRDAVNQVCKNAYYQTEQFEFEMDAEHLTVAHGAYATLQHDMMVVGLGTSKVASLQMSGPNVAGFTLDFGIATQAGPTLGARWRKIINTGGQGTIEIKDEVAVIRNAGDSRVFTFSSPRSTANAPAVGEMVTIGETGKVALEVLVSGIRPRPHLQAAVTCIAYAPERFSAGPTWPPHNPMTSLPLGRRPAQPVQQSVNATQQAITLSFMQPTSPRGVTLTGFECWVREKGTTSDQWEARASLGVDERVFVAPTGEASVGYDLRVVAVGYDSGGLPVRSDPLDVLNVSALGAPAAPAGCSASFATRTSSAGAQQIVLTANWTPNENPDVIDTRVEMQVSTGPDVWAEIGAGAPALGKTEIHGLQVGRAYVLGFTNISRRGVPSTRTVISSITAPDVIKSTAAVNADIAAGVAAASITLASFASGIKPVELAASLPVSGNTLGRTVLLSTDGKTYVYGSGGWGLLIGDVAPLSIDAARLQTDAVVAGKVAAAAINTRELAAGAVRAEQLLVQIGGNNLVRNSGLDFPSSSFAGFNHYDNSSQSTRSLTTGRNGGNAMRLTYSNNGSTKGFYFGNVGGVDNTGIFKAGRSYVFSWYAKASSTSIGKTMFTAWNNAPSTITTIENPPLTSDWQRYSFRLYWNTGATVDPNGYASIANAVDCAGNLDYCDIMVQEGEYPAAYTRGLLPGEVRGTLIQDGAILTNHVGANQITAGKLSVASLDAITGTIGLLRTATSGPRMELESNRIRIFDASAERIRIGDLS